jgi:hypothetical protein
MVRNVLFNFTEWFCLTRSLSTIPGFGRKMYTDYEIVCKVRTPAIITIISKPLTLHHPPAYLYGMSRYIRLISQHSSCATLSCVGAIQILKHFATYSSTNPLE